MPPDYVHLTGAEDVQRAGRNIADAAETISRAAGSYSETTHYALARAEDYVCRLEQLAENLQPAEPTCWQPIESAPYGIAVLVALVTHTLDDRGAIRQTVITDAHVADRDPATQIWHARFRGRDAIALDFAPTHWQPLPKVAAEEIPE